jgi:hypothetical protein
MDARRYFPVPVITGVFEICGAVTGGDFASLAKALCCCLLILSAPSYVQIIQSRLPITIYALLGCSCVTSGHM